jgi:hypothetical protein
LYGQPAPADLARVPTALKSKWQQRMVSFDLEKKLPALLQRNDFDVLLLDLIDERFPVMLFEGVPVTGSSEFGQGYGDIRSLRQMKADDPVRLHLWKQGVRALLQCVSPERIILNKVYWALRNSEGEMLPNQVRIIANNNRLHLMYRYLSSIDGLKVIEYAPELLIADPGHKWGNSPYHYIPPMYAHTIDCLRNCVATPG